MGITQDLRLSSPGDEGPLRWVVGLYFLREDTDVIDNSIATIVSIGARSRQRR